MCSTCDPIALRSTKRKHLVYYAFDLLDKDKSGEVDQSDLVRSRQRRSVSCSLYNHA